MNKLANSIFGKYFASAFLASLFLIPFDTVCLGGNYYVQSLSSGEKVPLEQAIADLAKYRLILVGELHDNKEHHEKQLAVIQALYDAGVKVAIGLEMFRFDSQKALDQWVSGEMPPDEFHPVYYDNWNFPWPYYSMIFEYAREKKIPMAGLNVGREITRQVAYEGFQSLSMDQKGKLEDVACIVDENYMAFIKKVFGDHSHGKLNFEHFCEAQLVWDTVMAIHALEYLEKNPGSIMVLLTGNGHARKPGIPTQIKKRSQLPHAVLLPETPGYITPDTVSVEDADYLIVKQP